MANNYINVMFCGNDKVIDGMIIATLSIVKYCKKPLNIHIMTMDLSNIEKRFTPINEKHCGTELYYPKIQTTHN